MAEIIIDESAACAHCAAPFFPPISRGRPIVVCSEICRVARRTARSSARGLAYKERNPPKARRPPKPPREPSAQEVSTICIECGVEFAYLRGTMRKKRRLCSSNCARSRARKVDWRPFDPTKQKYWQKVCIVCGKGFSTYNNSTVSCGLKCGAVLATKGLARYRAEHYRPRNACEQCGKQTKRDFRFCSKRCGGIARRIYPDRKTAKAEGRKRRYEQMVALRPPVPCAYCRVPFPVGRSRYCSDQCTQFGSITRALKLARDKEIAIANRPPIARRLCELCLTPYEPRGNSKFCKPECAKFGSRRLKKHKQRAEHWGVAYEPIIPREIFIRDNWRCQICKKKVNEKFAAPDPRSPSLDHIIAMSKGGPHLRTNVQCAHYGCNSRKGVMTVNGTQLLLIG